MRRRARARAAPLALALLACGPSAPDPDPATRAAAASAGIARAGDAADALEAAADPSAALAGDASEAPPEGFSRDAKPKVVRLLRAERLGHHPSDGGGRGWLRGGEDEPLRIPANARARLEIVYEAGPLGIAAGGSLVLRVSRYWGWSDPQVSDPEAPGYTLVRCDAPGVELAPAPSGKRRLSIGVAGRALEAGERIRILYGAGPALAHVDRYAERGERIWLYVDGDGDGAPARVEDSPALDLLPGAPARLLLHLPATARPGDAVELTAALLDRGADTGVPFVGSVALRAPPGLALPERVVFEAADAGRRRVAGRALAEGVYRVSGSARGEGAPELAAESNPLLVDAGARVLWGDLHGHSHLSDGTGPPEDYFRYARDVAALDVAALTDHDHWGMRYLDRSPGLWVRIQGAVGRFHEPGRFVTLLGYEWTNWLHGHRHVLYFADEGELLSALDPRYETPDRLWRALADRPALTFSHHSAGWPVSTNWNYLPDPRIEPVAEIVSLHGSSEAPDAPHPIEHPVAGNFVRDVLDRGVRLGFVGSGDGHDGHPGLTRLQYDDAGLAGILSPERTREGVREALLARRVYATNGARIVLRASLDGRPMGAALPAGDPQRAALELDFRAVADGAPFERVDLVRGGGVVRSLPGEGRRDWSWRGSVPALAAGEYLYLRAVQVDGGVAWSSPFFGGEPGG